MGIDIWSFPRTNLPCTKWRIKHTLSPSLSLSLWVLCLFRQVQASNGASLLYHLSFLYIFIFYVVALHPRSPRYITDKLQCVLNAAARLVTGTHKFDHGLTHLLHEELHWLDIPERIHYKLGVTVHRCLQYKAPEYLVDCCTPVSDIPSRRHLRSAARHHLTVPRYRLSTFGRRAFSVACPTV